MDLAEILPLASVSVTEEKDLAEFSTTLLLRDSRLNLRSACASILPVAAS